MGELEYHVLSRLATIVAVACVAQPVWAMSSPGPRALHVLIKMANVVAVVHVTERTENDLGEGQVKARVDQLIYGDVDIGHAIPISEFDLNGCAGPVARYEVGQRVLVLLHGNQKQGFRTCGNLYGARVLDDHQQTQCIERIKEFYRIRTVKDDGKRKLFWAEWAVRCAEQPCTLEDGLALLGRGTHLGFGTDPKPGDPTWYFPLVSQDQRGRLLQVLENALASNRIPKEICDLMRIISYVDQNKELHEIALDAERELSLPDRARNRLTREERTTAKLTPYVERFIQHKQN